MEMKYLYEASLLRCGVVSLSLWSSLCELNRVRQTLSTCLLRLTERDWWMESEQRVRETSTKVTRRWKPLLLSRPGDSVCKNKNILWLMIFLHVWHIPPAALDLVASPTIFLSHFFSIWFLACLGLVIIYIFHFAICVWSWNGEKRVRISLYDRCDVCVMGCLGNV